MGVHCTELIVIPYHSSVVGKVIGYSSHTVTVKVINPGFSRTHLPKSKMNSLGLRYDKVINFSRNKVIDY